MKKIIVHYDLDIELNAELSGGIMGKKFYITGRCPVCDTPLTVKHRSEDCECKYCEYCERIVKEKKEFILLGLAIMKVESA